MKVRLDQIPENGLPLTFTGDQDVLGDALSAIRPPPGVEIDPQVHGSLVLTNSGSDVRLTGNVRASMRLQCARCLSVYHPNPVLGVNFLLRQGIPEDQFTGDATKNDESVLFVDGPEFDPGEVILQELLLEIPMKPLCREDCEGLCPRCGAPKSSAECTCPAESAMDPRWQKLARLKKDLKP